jgi:hypothetical protein
VNEYATLGVQVVSIAVAGAAVFFAVTGVGDQLRLQTFSEYTRRYGDIFGSLSSAARDPHADFSLEELEPTERDRHLNIARSYFNLCSEEFYLHRRGRIDRDTWGIWCRGMRDTMRSSWLRTTWDKIQDEYTYVDEFVDFFDETIGRRA